MATTSERREAAERLRKYAGVSDFDTFSEFYTKLNEVLFDSEVWFETDGEIFGSLADLIDPTCHDLGGEEGTNFEGYDFGCSACGYACDLPQPNYCPNCGARVVSSDAD